MIIGEFVIAPSSESVHRTRRISSIYVSTQLTSKINYHLIRGRRWKGKIRILRQWQPGIRYSRVEYMIVLVRSEKRGLLLEITEWYRSAQCKPGNILLKGKSWNATTIVAPGIRIETFVAEKIK